MKVTVWKILSNKRAMICALSSVIAMIFMLFMDSILSNYLVESFGVAESNVGWFFALPCLVYSLSCPLVGYMTNFVPRIYLTQSAFLLTFVGMLMFGPSSLLKYPHSLTLSTLGNCLDGFACALIFVPLLSEIVEAVKEKEGMTEATEELNDLAAGFFNTSYALGCMLAPILGGILNDYWGFQTTCDIFAMLSLAYAIVFFAVCIAPTIKDKLIRKTSRTKQTTTLI